MQQSYKMMFRCAGCGTVGHQRRQISSFAVEWNPLAGRGCIPL